MRTILAAIVLLVGTVPVAAEPQERLSDQVRKGVVLEETNRDLQKAIQVYRGVVSQFDEERKAAGTAVFRLAECYRKSGQRDQAVAEYQRVLRQFGDLANVAEPSRVQLKNYGVAVQTTAAPESPEIQQLRQKLAESRAKLTTTEGSLAALRSQRSPLVSERGQSPVRPAEAKLDLESLRQQVSEAQKKVEINLLPPADLRALQTQLERAELRYQQSIADYEDTQRQAEEARKLNQMMLASVEKEIVLVQGQIQAIEAKVAVGVMSPQDTDLLRLRRDLLELQRKADELRIWLKR